VFKVHASPSQRHIQQPDGAANNWDHLSDVGKLSALVNLYNATDKLAEAFGAKASRTFVEVAANDEWIRRVAWIGIKTTVTTQQ
jgi:hypothetical protein